MNLWKALGLAGLAGVAAAGVIIAREQRQRTQLEPEEIRARLHERLEQASATPDAIGRRLEINQWRDGALGRQRRPPWARRRPGGHPFRARSGLPSDPGPAEA